MISRTAIAILAFLLPAAIASAAPEDAKTSAEQLATGCRKIADGIASTPTYSQTLMVGRCHGIMDTLSGVGPALPEDLAFCVPRTATGKQRSGVFLKYLDRHPEVSRESAAKIMFLAFREAWPCD